VCDAAFHLDAKPLEMLRHQLGRSMLAVGELWMRVDVASPGNDVRLNVRRPAIDLRSEILGTPPE
jgi:hypothetical protein